MATPRSGSTRSDVHTTEDAPRAPRPVGRPRRSLLPADWRRSLGLGLVASAGLVGSFPPVGLWPLALLPVWAAIRASDPTRVCRPSGFWFAIGTIPAYAWLTRWAAQGATAGYPFLVLYLAMYMGVVVWVMGRVRRRSPRGLDGLVVPPVWVGVEALRGLLAFNGFPWLLVEHPLIDAVGGAFAFPATFGGIWLVGGLLALLAWLLDGALQSRRPLRWAIGAAAFAGAWGAHGFFGVLEQSRKVPAAVVAVLQTNVPQSIKTGWSFDDRWADWLELRRMLMVASEPDERGIRPDLIFVPETMFPGFVLQGDAAAIEREREVGWFFEPDPETGRREAIRAGTVRDELLEVSRRIGDIPIVIGATRYEGFRIEEDDAGMRYESDARFNSVFMLRNGELVDQTYDKQELTPFGEVMPYISNWPWLERAFLSLAARGMSFNLQAGDRRTVFVSEVEAIDPGAGELSAPSDIRFVAPVCYEATVGKVCRGLVFDDGDRRADLLVNLTNDGWFYDAVGGRELHLLMARWRSLELATPMVRAANTGISSVIGTAGEVRAALGAEEAGVLIASVPVAGGATAYARIGDAIGWICLAGAIFGAVASYLPMQRGSGRANPAPDATRSGARTGTQQRGGRHDE